MIRTLAASLLLCCACERAPAPPPDPEPVRAPAPADAASEAKADADPGPAPVDALLKRRYGPPMEMSAEDRKLSKEQPELFKLKVLRDDASPWMEYRFAAEGLAGYKKLKRPPLVDKLDATQRAEALALIAKRIAEINRVAQHEKTAPKGHFWWTGQALLLSLARLQPDRAGSLLDKQIVWMRAQDATEEEQWKHKSILSELFDAWIDSGAPEALPAYLAWLESVDPTEGHDWHDLILHPMLKGHEDSRVLATAARLFGDGDKAWPPLLNEAAGPRMGYLLTSPALKLKPFRARILRRLADTRAAGTWRQAEKGRLALTSADWWPGRLGAAEQAAAGKGRPFRVCDLYALALSDMPGIPKFRFSWPEKKRDLAIAAIKAFLERYGPHFVHSAFRIEREPAYQVQAHPHSQAGFRFLLRDQPATPEDVARGLAIFSLENENARVVATPSLPWRARWHRPGKPPEPGLVWQVEERSDGSKRTYGFVWHAGLETLKPSDLSFPDATPEDARVLSRGWFAQFPPPDARANESKLPAGMDSFFHKGALYKHIQRYRADKPMMVSLKLTNSRGLDQPLKVWPQPIPSDSRLPSGIFLSMRVTPLEEKPRRLPPKKTKDRKPAPRPVELSFPPGVALTALSFDLRDHFDLGTDGDYELTLRFSARSGLPPGQMSTKFHMGDLYKREERKPK